MWIQFALLKEIHKMHLSGVSILHCFVSHSRPDKVNYVHELSKVPAAVTEASYKEMLHFIKYVLE